MGRAPCCDKDGLKKGPWLPEEDHKLVDYIQKNGPGNWRTLPKKAGLERCGKSCRLRWTNYLRPDIKRGRFSFEEEEAIIQLHSVLGNKWSAIAAKLPGRTDNEIKNYWNTHIRKRLLRMGIDPVTHTRRFDFLDLPSIFSTHSASFLQNSSDQLNLLKLLGLQSLVNPNLLGLASLLSTNQIQNQNQNFLVPNMQPNQLANHCNQIMAQNPFIDNNHPIPNINPTCSPMLTQANTTILSDTNAMKSSLDHQQQQHPTKFSNSEEQNFAAAQTSALLNDQWQPSNGAGMHTTEAAGGIQDSDNYQAIMDSLLETLGLNSANNISNNNNHDLRMPSLLSTPCSSQQTPPLSTSNSAYQPNSSSNTTSSEDEIDSYCQNLMNFDVHFDIFDNNV